MEIRERSLERIREKVDRIERKFRELEVEARILLSTERGEYRAAAERLRSQIRAARERLSTPPARAAGSRNEFKRGLERLGEELVASFEQIYRLHKETRELQRAQEP